jgi:hypothetical protein
MVRLHHQNVFPGTYTSTHVPSQSASPGRRSEGSSNEATPAQRTTWRKIFIQNIMAHRGVCVPYPGKWVMISLPIYASLTVYLYLDNFRFSRSVGGSYELDAFADFSTQFVCCQ